MFFFATKITFLYGKVRDEKLRIKFSLSHILLLSHLHATGLSHSPHVRVSQCSFNRERTCFHL